MRRRKGLTGSEGKRRCRWKGRGRRAVALLMAALFCVSGPIQSAASVEATKTNSQKENNEILSTLQAITGDEKSAEEIYRQLEALNLADSSGKLVTKNLMVDGQEKTIQEVLKMIEGMDEKELDQTAEVEGMKISFRDLRTMAQIEAELARIQDTYFNGNIKLTKEQRKALDSLHEQLNADGISIQGFADVGEGISFPSGVDRQAHLEVTASFAGTEGQKAEGGDGQISVHNANGSLTFQVSLEEAKDYPVSFEATTIAGSAAAGAHYEELHSKKYTIEAGQTTATVEVELHAVDNSDDGAYSWNGQRVFFVRFDRPENVSFQDGADSVFYQVNIQGEAALDLPEGALWSFDTKEANNPEFHKLPSSSWLYRNRSNPKLSIRQEVYHPFSNTVAGWGVGSGWQSVSGDNGKIALQKGKGELYSAEVTVLLDGEELFLTRMGYCDLPKGDQEDIKEICVDLENGIMGVPIGVKFFADNNPVYTEAMNYRPSNVPLMDIRKLENLNDRFWNTVMEKGIQVPLDSIKYHITSYDADNGPLRVTGKTSMKREETATGRVVVRIVAENPTLLSATVPAEAYRPGDEIPIVLEFDRPLKVLKQSAGKLRLAETVGTVSKQMTLLAKYDDSLITDPHMDKIVTMDEVKNAIVGGAYLDSWTNRPPEGIQAEGISLGVQDVSLMPEEEDFVNSSQVSFEALAAGGVVEPGVSQILVKLALSQEAYEMLAANNTETGEDGAIYTNRLAVSGNGEKFAKLFFANAEGEPVKGGASCLATKVDLPMNTGDGDVRGAVELYWMKDGKPESVVVNQYAAYTRKPAALMLGEDLTIHYAEGYPQGVADEDEIYLDTENVREKLKLSWSAAAGKDYTWPTDVSWAPADEESRKVASIDQNGQITLTGNSGIARFVLTAENNGFTPREGEEETLYQVVSDPIRVGVGNTPFLMIADTSKTVSVQEGQQALVMWQTNLFDKNGMANNNRDFETKAVLNLYKAVYDENGNFQEKESLEKKNLVQGGITVTGTQNKPVNEYFFDGLKKLQEKGRHSYVFTVEMQADAAVPGQWPLMKAAGYIDVTARPASVAVSRPEGGLYLTDDAGSLTLTWNSADVDAVEGAQAYVAVTDNSTGEKVAEETYELDADVQEAITVPLQVENGFRTTYTVEAKIKNKNDTGWSVDSYQLNLYHADSLKLLMDGMPMEEGETVTISNRETIGSMDQDDILALERQIFLQSGLSINYDEYPWQDLEDRMKWNAESQEEAAEIQTMYGSKYVDIRDVNLKTYSPSQEQLLVGKSDGSAQVSVEHQFAPELKAGVDVEIETLKDRLYLFQFYPMGKTEFTYVNGDGEKQTKVSNDRGEAAVYEESGIAGDVYARQDSGAVYMGTVYQESLDTSERDAGSLELYPLNVLRLKKVSTVPLSFKTPDGKPYTGEITVHGGVLMDGVYDPEIRLDRKDGAEGFQLKLDSDGSHTFEFDMTQFPEEYKENAIQFIFEFQFEDDAYEPVYLDMDGTLNSEAVVRLARNIVSLRAHDAAAGRQPVTTQKRLYFSDGASGGYRNVLDTTGRVGPGTNNPVVTVETTAAWWGSERGEADETRRLIYLDKYGKELPSQTSELIDYPFLTMPVLKNQLVMDETAMEEMGLDTGETLAMELAYQDSAEKLLRQETSKLRIINMLGMEDVTDSERLQVILSEITSASSNNSEVKFANSMAGVGLALATKLSIVNTQQLRLKLLPTADPTRFQGFVSFGLNNMTGDNVTMMDPQYENDGDLDYMPGLDEVKSAISDGAEKTVKEKATLVKYASALLKDQGKRGLANGSSSNGAMKDGSPYYALQGYFETEVFYDYENEKWEMAVLNGGFTVGGGFGKDWKWNSFVGPVPVLAELGFGVGLMVDFQAAVDRQEMVNEYLTELRLMAYLRAFAGIGFDYAVIALKIGLYGQVNLDARINFLNSRDAISTPKVGLYLGGSGEFGILFAVRFLFISYQKILVGVSGDIGSTSNSTYKTNVEYWEKVKNGRSGQDYPYIEAEEAESAAEVNARIRQIPRAKLVMRDEASNLNVYEVPIDATLEERDYLELFDRSWNLEEEPGFFGRLAEGAKSVLRSFGLMKPEAPEVRDSEGAGITSVWENAYPYANPRVSEDGRFLAYLTDQDADDVTKTRVAVRDLKGGGNELIVDNDGFGDNYLTMAGTGDKAVMAWGRSTMNLKKDPGAVITDAEQNQMMASSEIMAARWNEETGKWEVKELTKNTVGDVSPAVATNGDRTVVVWRRGAGTDSSQVVNFNARDEIVYRVYDGAKGGWTEDQAWSNEQILYNGTSGTASGLEAAMLPDGTAGVVFAVDTAKAANGAELAMLSNDDGLTAAAAVDEETGEVKSLVEIMFGVIRKDSFDEDAVNSTRLIRATSDEYLDENPQIAAVKLTDTETEDGGQRFVLGWHSLQSFNGVQQNDIQLRAYDGNGNMENSFPSAVSKAANSASAMPGAIFRFSKGAKTLEELSILWREPAMEVYQDEDGETGEETGSEEAEGGSVIDYDVLRAMRFTVEQKETDGGVRYGMTAAQILASMGDQTVIENFDAYLTSKGSLEAMILGSRYNTGLSEDVPVDLGTGSTGEVVSVAKPESRIYKAAGNYVNKLDVDFVLPDYRILYKNSRIPVQIGVTNQGTSEVTEVQVTFESDAKTGLFGTSAARQQTQTFAFGGENEPAALLPGESRTLTVYYETGDRISDVHYTVKTTFANSRTKAKTEGSEETPQIMKLDIPDLAISAFEVKKEQDGKRLLQLSIYNGNEAKLAETAHDRVVKLGLYTDAECSEPVDSSYLTEIQTRSRNGDGAIKTLNKTDSMAELQMVDAGTYTVQYEFDIARFIETADPETDSFRDENGEIRESGITLYAKVWAEDEDQEDDPAEFVTSNNIQSVRLESLIKRAEGELASVETSLKNPDTEEGQGGSQVTVTVQNNSIKEESSGNLIVTLLDSNGRILEAKQLYQKNQPNQGLLSIPGEGIETRVFMFTQIGASAKAYYSNDILDDSTDIKDITLDKTGLQLAKFTPYNEGGEKNIRVADVETSNLFASQLIVKGNNAASTVTVEGAEKVEAEGEKPAEGSAEGSSGEEPKEELTEGSSEEKTKEGLAEGSSGEDPKETIPSGDTGWYIGNVELRPGKVSQIVIQAMEENEQGVKLPVTYIINVINRYVDESTLIDETEQEGEDAGTPGVQPGHNEEGGAAA